MSGGKFLGHKYEFCLMSILTHRSLASGSVGDINDV